MTTTPTPTPSAGAAALLRDWAGTPGYAINELTKAFKRDLPDQRLPEAYLADLAAADQLAMTLPPPPDMGALADAYLSARQRGVDPTTDRAVARALNAVQLARSGVGVAIEHKAHQARTQALRDHHPEIIATLLDIAGGAADTLRASRALTEIGDHVTINRATPPEVFTAWSTGMAALKRFEVAAGLWGHIVRGLHLAKIDNDTRLLVFADLPAAQLEAFTATHRAGGRHPLVDLVNQYRHSLSLVSVDEFKQRCERVEAERRAKIDRLERQRQERLAPTALTPPQAMPPELREQYAKNYGRRERRADAERTGRRGNLAD